MMIVLIGIALKSLLIAGLTLGVLALMRNRSAAERSWIAHIGLLALIIMAFAPLALPRWAVEMPSAFSHTTSAAAPLTSLPKSNEVSRLSLRRAQQAAAVDAPARTPQLDPAAAATAVYAIPALVLLIITFLALLRLFALRSRADVLVDGHWLSALARAQRRMGFKHGTALLTSNELASPISWGLMRPVILLNNRAIEAADEAEAIIAHELAHVARMDWLKLLLARLATALFWFNPLVWLLAREAHQLREEAADDSVLAADIVDTDYAQLLVGVARHECPGLLLGAHGVAPSRNSLARRVARVLDGKSVRGPVARSFALGAFTGAVLIAAPLAALTITPARSEMRQLPGSTRHVNEPSASLLAAADVPADLPHLIARGVSTSMSTASAAVVPSNRAGPSFRTVAQNGASVEAASGITVAQAPGGAKVTVYPPDNGGRRRIVAIAPNGATAVTYSDGSGYASAGRPKRHDSTIETALEMKAVGMTPEYAAAIRAASPSLRVATFNQIVQLKALGVTPDYVRAITAAGFGNLGASEIEQARAVGLSPDYLREMRATGVSLTFDDLMELRALGVRPTELARMRASGTLTPGKINRIWHGPKPPPVPQPPEPPEDNSDPG